jgi:hypothetical protein
MASLVSAGTEEMRVGIAKKSLVGKAASQPRMVKKVAESPYPLDRHQVRDHLELRVPGHQNR